MTGVITPDEINLGQKYRRTKKTNGQNTQVYIDLQLPLLIMWQAFPIASLVRSVDILLYCLDLISKIKQAAGLKYLLRRATYRA